MNTALTIVLALLVFGLLIFIHEFGHYIFARIFKVKINEFSVGMGPKLLWYDSKKTGIRYALSMLPIGGYVAMAGEDDESDDPNSFDKKPAWQRFIITAAGAVVNLVAGFIVMTVLVGIVPIGNTEIAAYYTKEQTGYEVSSSDSGLMEGDIIVAVDGKKVKIVDELSYEIMRRGTKPIDITVIRGGSQIVIPDVVFPGMTEEGQSFGIMDFKVYQVERSFGNLMSHAMRKSYLTVRMCWESIYDLITGRYTFEAVSGPVGISSAIGDAAKDGTASLLHIAALISINLGFMNLLPIPALDGGRLITILAEMVTRKRIPKKVEGIINGVGLALLLLLSLVIMVKDIFKLIV
ncbi:MAG: site-2 protease family protein [Ruminococcaceae bacterium]|nr:site-2 protease family protein [Oscillospiraceae bacterium]